MLNLLRAELLRLISDRKVAVCAAIVLMVGCWNASALAETVKPYTALDWDEAQRQSNDAQIDLDVACGSGTSSIDCSSLPASITVEGFLRPQVSFEQFAINSLALTTHTGLFVLVVLTTIMIGSEFSTGAIGTQLTFTPRRLPLLWAKVAAAAICGVVLMALWLVSTVVLDVFFFLNVNGTEGLSAGSLLAAQIGRGLLTALILVVMAASVTMAVASAVKSWVLISAGLVISQFVESSGGIAQTAWLLPTTNLASLVNGEWTRAVYGSDGVLRGQIPHLDHGYSVGYAAFWVVVFAIWASVAFSRRNILK